MRIVRNGAGKRLIAFFMSLAVMGVMIPGTGPVKAEETVPQVDFEAKDWIEDSVPVTLYDYDRSPSGHDIKVNNRNDLGETAEEHDATVDLMTVNDAAYQAAKEQGKGAFYFGNPWSYHTAFYEKSGVWTNKNFYYIVRGILQDEMQDGRAVFNGDIADPGFFTPESNSFKQAYPGVSFHVTKDDSGYYSFDSSSQKAVFDRSSGSIRVSGQKDGNFFPFGEENDSQKFSFGMSMTIPFLLPEDGKVNGKPMKFEFSGDDDVWVFVDGKLALDIGGIHEAKSGSIDFSTGKAVVDYSSYYQNGKSRSGSDTKYLWGNHGNNLNISKTAPIHTLSMYYLERGDNLSTCKFKYNLQQAATVTVGKNVRIDGLDSREKTDATEEAEDQEFTFRMQYGDTAGSLSPYADQPYLIQEGEVITNDTGETDENGELTLKSNQKAVFLSPNPDLNGKVLAVTETGEEAEGYTTTWTASQNGTRVFEQASDDKDAVIRLATIDTADRSRTMNYEVNFTNSKTVQPEPSPDEDIGQSKTAEHTGGDDSRTYRITLNVWRGGEDGSSGGTDASSKAEEMESQPKQAPESAEASSEGKDALTGADTEEKTDASPEAEKLEGQPKQAPESAEASSEGKDALTGADTEEKTDASSEAEEMESQPEQASESAEASSEGKDALTGADAEEKADASPEAEESEGQPKQASKSLEEPSSVENHQKSIRATIIDTLDPRFELKDNDERARLEKDGAIIRVQDGVTTITWEDQTVPDEKEWTKEIQIRAKDDFLGGNDIPTNAPYKSKIVWKERGDDEEKEIPFDLPTVNVPVRFSVENKETSIFLGDTVPVSLEEGGQQKDVLGLMADLSRWDWYGKEATGTFRYQWLDEKGNPLCSAGTYDAVKNTLQDLAPSGDSNQYTLKVTFTPKTDGGDSSGPRQEAVTESDDYTVNVVRGTVSVTKKIASSDVWSPNGDPIVTFKLERIVNDSTAETRYRTVRFDDTANPGQDGMLSLTAVFNDLKKGKYRVTEENALRYRYQDADVGEGDNASSVQDEKAVYAYLGYASQEDSTTDVGKNSASAVFTNEAKNLDQPYFSHTDTKSNAIKITFTGKNHTVNPDGSKYVTEQERSAAENSAEKARPVSAARRPAAEWEEEARGQEEDLSEPQPAVKTPSRVQPESSSSETAEESPPPGTSGESRPTEQSPPAEPDFDPSGQQEVRAEDDASAPAKESEPLRETVDLPGAKEESE
ncbi:MAG TPA: hypothetical protein DD433_06155 [Ruminococcaceae bacterium]|nr:hypothetical protein [Oscillospiraceae bacterium]